MLQIGRHFLSAAYIMVNYDVGEFLIWTANPTGSQDLVVLDATGAEFDIFCLLNVNTATTTAGGRPREIHIEQATLELPHRPQQIPILSCQPSRAELLVVLPGSLALLSSLGCRSEANARRTKTHA